MKKSLLVLVAFLILSLSPSSEFSLFAQSSLSPSSEKQEAKESIKFRIVQKVFESPSAAQQYADENGMESIENNNEYHIVPLDTDLDSNFIESMVFTRDDWGFFDLTFTLNEEGAKKFEEMTEENIGNNLLVDYEKFVICNAIIRQKISGGAIAITDEKAVKFYTLHARKLNIQNPDNVKIPEKEDFVRVEKSDEKGAFDGFEPVYLEDFALLFYYCFLNEPDQLEEFLDEKTMYYIMWKQEEIQDCDEEIWVDIEKTGIKIDDNNLKPDEYSGRKGYALYTEIVIGGIVEQGMTFLAYDDDGELYVSYIPSF